MYCGLSMCNLLTTVTPLQITHDVLRSVNVPSRDYWHATTIHTWYMMYYGLSMCHLVTTVTPLQFTHAVLRSINVPYIDYCDATTIHTRCTTDYQCALYWLLSRHYNSHTMYYGRPSMCHVLTTVSLLQFPHDVLRSINVLSLDYWHATTIHTWYIMYYGL